MIVDLTGKRFGHLLVLELTHKRINSSAVWLCQCDCGGFCEESYPRLTRGIAKSCGCDSPNNNLEGRVFGKLQVIEKKGILNTDANACAGTT